MYATLHGAFGTWPTESDQAFTIRSASKDSRPSALNETFDFEETSIEPGRPVFTFKQGNQPNDIVFIPPFFVPPGAVQSRARSRPTLPNSQGQPQGNLHATRSSYTEPAAARPADQRNQTVLEVEEETAVGPSTSAQVAQLDGFASLDQSPPETSRIPGANIRPPSPLSTPEMDAERMELWSPEARKAFHDMVTSPGYINRYRLHMKKRERMMQYLQNPDREPMLCDGSRDHQTKYQAAHWTVMEGKLYRNPESGRVPRYRRHLDDFEAWDVLTMEHIRSGHLGRDKLRKVLEQNYIGYTLQEIMFVLKECKKCANRGVNTERKDSSNDVEMEDAADVLDANTAQESYGQTTTPPTPPKGPYGREQTSNFMWF